MAQSSVRGACGFVLTVYPHTLTETGRYTHHERHIREAATAFGLEVRLLEEEFLREEDGAPVTGLYTVLYKPAA
jgi:predicted TPR repeat methyltransferase